MLGIVGVAAAFGAGLATFPLVSGARSRVHPWRTVADELLPMDRAVVDEIGPACEASLAEHGKPLSETRRLAGFAWDDEGVRTPRDISAVYAAFMNRIADEFAEGRVLVVERWVLSETQAALCALAARSRMGGG